jgi:outer membrane protein assembly factor BamD (BamD/ComL family)
MYEYLISKYPSNIEYVIALTNIYVRDNEYLKARKVLKRFISKNPQERTNSRLAPYGIIRLGL